MWIESHQTLGSHPKTKKLARLLGVDTPTAVGHLHYLWWWAMDYAPNGSLRRYDAADIADAALWKGDPQQFVDAAVAAGFLDGDESGLCIHAWDQYTGRLMDQRERKRVYDKAQRAKNKAAVREKIDEIEKAEREALYLSVGYTPPRYIPSSQREQNTST